MHLVRVVTAFSLFATNERYRASWAGHTLYQIQIMGLGHGEKSKQTHGN